MNRLTLAVVDFRIRRLQLQLQHLIDDLSALCAADDFYSDESKFKLGCHISANIDIVDANIDRALRERRLITGSHCSPPTCHCGMPSKPSD